MPNRCICVSAAIKRKLYFIYYFEWGFLSDLFVLLWLSFPLYSFENFFFPVFGLFILSRTFTDMNLWFFLRSTLSHGALWKKSVDFYVRHAIFYTNYRCFSKQNKYSTMEWEIHFICCNFFNCNMCKSKWSWIILII